MNYTLYSGAGNTFALTKYSVSKQHIIHICETLDIDGLILAQSYSKMRIFNRDGTEAGMCGNGLRCFVQFLIDQKHYKKRYTIQTMTGTYTAWSEKNHIYVQCPPPQESRWNLRIDPYTIHYLDTGVPHAVLFVDSVLDIDLNTLGPKIRNHPFFPNGANFNVVQIDPFYIRTYERGVERETLACGTGALASALAANKLFNLPSPLSVKVQSKETITISFSSDWKMITMEGPVQRLGEGTFPLNRIASILSST